MKSLLCIALLLASFTSHASRIKFFKVSLTEDTEELLLEKVEATIPKILRGRVRSVFHDFSCSPNNSRTIKVLSVQIDKAYKVDGNGNLVPYYVGVINYRHNSCRD